MRCRHQRPNTGIARLWYHSSQYSIIKRHTYNQNLFLQSLLSLKFQIFSRDFPRRLAQKFPHRQQPSKGILEMCFPWGLRNLLTHVIMQSFKSTFMDTIQPVCHQSLDSSSNMYWGLVGTIANTDIAQLLPFIHEVVVPARVSQASFEYEDTEPEDLDIQLTILSLGIYNITIQPTTAI